jgi:hypothetical protein
VNRLQRDQRGLDRHRNRPLRAMQREREHFFEADVDPLERSEIGEPVFRHDVFEALDLGRHGIEILVVQDAEQACEIEPAFVPNLERHGPSLCRHAALARQ